MHHPTLLSTQLCLGWEGLLIEGNPKEYPKLIENRPKAHRISFSPTCTAEEEALNKTVSFHDFPFTNAGIDGNALAYKNLSKVDVPCGPLTPVLQDLLDGRITFFSLDVEGAEQLVLAQIDFTAVFIEVLMIESFNNFCQNEGPARDRVREMMDSVGYKRHEGVVRNSDLYVHPKSVYQLKTE